MFQFVQGAVRSPYVVTSDFSTLYEYVKTSPVMNAAGLRTGGYTARMGLGAQMNQIFTEVQALEIKQLTDCLFGLLESEYLFVGLENIISGRMQSQE